MEFYSFFTIFSTWCLPFQFPTGWNSTIWRSRKLHRENLVSIPNGMEFYRIIGILLIKFMFVSIPNGMEFYFSSKRVYIVYKVFQFPTGWNSTVVNEETYEADYSFNSQRDGILPKVGSFSSKIPKFQFPTGWNSTGLGVGHLGFDGGFNSQRDGILLFTNLLCGSGVFSFNSQRDGILLCAIIKRRKPSVFQFPTGWNSTCLCRLKREAHHVVSIPNGMEFYGEICRVLISLREFQFPTGWNSTAKFAEFLSHYESFNSQRDGILPYINAFNAMAEKRFNSQRDGILLFKNIFI